MSTLHPTLRAPRASNPNFASYARRIPPPPPRQFLMDLLKAVEAAVPPPPHTHHALMYARYGNDEAGWEDRLALQINRDGKFHTFFLDDEDFQLSPQKLGFLIAVQLEMKVSREQLGVAMGQFA